jgi:hypothetical protein
VVADPERGAGSREPRPGGKVALAVGPGSIPRVPGPKRDRAGAGGPATEWAPERRHMSVGGHRQARSFDLGVGSGLGTQKQGGALDGVWASCADVTSAPHAGAPEARGLRRVVRSHGGPGGRGGLGPAAAPSARVGPAGAQRRGSGREERVHPRIGVPGDGPGLFSAPCSGVGARGSREERGGGRVRGARAFSDPSVVRGTPSRLAYTHRRAAALPAAFPKQRCILQTLSPSLRRALLA